jgi:hypothetical protein
MDVVYINQKTPWKNQELLYSLRSLEKFVANYNRVFLVGYKPDFISEEVIHVPYDDKFVNRATNIMMKVLTASEQEDLSEDFMLLNDDYFFVDHIDGPTYPYYFKCDLQHTIQIQRNEYQKHVIPTYKELIDRKLPTKNFDTHKPIIYNKELFQNVVQEYDWNRPYGFILRSIYCNTLGIEGIERVDNKINHSHVPENWERMTKGLDCFSVGDQSTDQYLQMFLNKLLPSKSKYEK